MLEPYENLFRLSVFVTDVVNYYYKSEDISGHHNS